VFALWNCFLIPVALAMQPSIFFDFKTITSFFLSFLSRLFIQGVELVKVEKRALV
jgi:hypothetical protein